MGRTIRRFLLSSRSRHTRYWRDWSSDVCSSDLAVAWETTSAAETHALGKALGEACAGREVMALVGPLGAGKTCLVRGIAEGLGVPTDLVAKIGRASCRERMKITRRAESSEQRKQ